MAVAGVKQVSSTGSLLQGGTSTQNTQTVQQTQPTANISTIQPAGGIPAPAPTYQAPPTGYTDPQVLAAQTAAAEAAAQARAEAAAKEAEAARYREQITGLANTIKDVFNSRYGQVDSAAADQVGRLNTRFGAESGDVTRQIGDENQKVGAAYAGRGSFDSSYRGNSVDTVTRAGESQIRDLGTELEEGVGKIGGWVAQQKAGYDAEKGGQDAILSRLADEKSPDALASLRNQLDARIAQLRAEGANNNTQAQNASSLASIAPSSQRTVQLKTTLSQIISGNADSSMKAAIGSKLIQNAGLSPEEQQKLATAFQSDLGTDPNQLLQA